MTLLHVLMFWESIWLPLLFVYGSLEPFKNTSWSLLGTNSMVKHTSRSNSPLTLAMDVFIAAKTPDTFPPWYWAYSPVHAKAKR